ncbi:MAG: lamin tail domain-containing protein, partial [Bacteroidales bacterium]
RNQSDVLISSNPAVKLAITSVNNGINPYESIDFPVTVQAQDVSGNPAYPSNNINFTFSTNGGTTGTVVFSPGSATSGTILAGTSQIIVNNVNMAPSGTNVTITANDDNPFGLQSGTSLPFDVTEFVIPQIIITEIMQDPFAVADSEGEWFEIFNNEDYAIDMTGWVIKDDGTDSHIIAGPLTVPSKGFAVLGRNSSSLVNGGYTADYQYSGFVLGNSDDEVVILLPDGITEVARVNYTGVAPWPDPTGASMIFTGLPGDDNNDPANWSVAILREPSYTGTAGDLGSPGTNGTGQNLTSDDLFQLDLKVYLEGAFDAVNTIMSSSLNIEGYLPSNHPFNPSLPYYGNNAPRWLYGGTGTAISLPANAIDWVLVELRDATTPGTATSATSSTKKPGLLLADGSIVALNGISPLGFNAVFNDLMFIVVWSRNHLSIMSAAGIADPTGTVSWDFTTAAGQTFGANGSKELTPGVWGMFAGDVNADGIVNDADKSPAGWKTEVGEQGYLGSDLNLDSQSSNVDKNQFWLPNYLKNTQVPN